MPNPNIFGLTGPAYPATFPATLDGWWLAVGPLTPGRHMLHFGVTTAGVGAYAGGSFTQDVTYNLTVQSVSEPTGLGLLTAAAVGLWAWRRAGRTRGRPA